jgi:hypothetical protein
MVKQPARKAEIAKPSNENTVASRALHKIRLSLPFSMNHPRSIMISAIFLATGIAALLLSIFLASQTLALVGLGLTFWGALFILIAPLRYVEGSLLASTAVATYLTIDRIVGDFNCSGKAYYLPPISREQRLPDYLEGLKDPVAFISFSEDGTLPSVDDIAKNKFVLAKRRGVLVTPPGLGLMARAEKDISPEIAMDMDDLCEVMPKIMLENYALAKDMTLHAEADRVDLTLLDSLYMNLYTSKRKLKSISLLGCPIASAIACAIAKTTGKVVVIQKIESSEENRETEVEYHLIQG